MKTASSARRPSWLRACAWVLGGLLALFLLAWAAMPLLLRWQIESQGLARLGRVVQVGQVAFAPWSLRTTLTGLQVAGPPGAPVPLLEVERLRFRTALSSLWQGAPVIEALEIDAPRLHLARLAPGRYDIDDLVEKLSAPADPPSPPARFLLRGLRLSRGSIDFEDRVPAGAPLRHSVRDLALALPALSSLPAERDNAVRPTLAFTLDGSRFDSSAEGLPYAELRKGEAVLRLDGLDLQRWRDWLPAGLPLRLERGTLDARLKLRFAQQPQPAPDLLEVSGDLQLRTLSLQDPQGRPAFAVDSLKIGIARLAPLQRQVKLERLELQGPRLQLARDGAGRLNLLPAPEGDRPGAPAAQPWTVDVAALSLRDGALDWRDAGQPALPAARLRAVQLDADTIAWPAGRAAGLRGSAQLALGADGTAPVRLQWSGQAGLEEGRMRLSAAALPLAWAQPWLADRLPGSLRGSVDLDTALNWSARGLQLADGKLTATDLALVQGGNNPVLAARRLAVQDLGLDLAGRQLAIGRVDLTAPSGRLLRDRQGRLALAGAGAPARSAPQATSAAGAAKQASEVPPWRIALKALQVQDGQLFWRDEQPARPVALELAAIRVQSGDLAWPRPAGARGFPLQLDASVNAARATPGRLHFKGSLAPQPLLLDGQVQLARLPLQALEPYFADAFNATLVRAELDYAGSLRLGLPPAGLELQARGDLRVDRGRIDSASPEAPAALAGPMPRQPGALTPGAARANTLLSWGTLQLRTAQLRIAPGKPLFWGVYGTTLGDFYARLAIGADGKLNVRQLVRQPAGQPPAGAATAATPAAAPELHFGETHLVNGRVQFTDNFIQPSYSLALSELEGVVGAYDSIGAVYDEPAMATVALRGKAEGAAALAVTGKLNPLANPLAVDLVTKVDDLDLPALSPYARKYAGHGIQRGKLSMQAHYRIEPDGRLEATNSLVLRQLVFDERTAEGGSTLPVRLAAALLADSNGVIDLDLPISGSVNDPQFSLGPVIGRALRNLLLRIVTSPFALMKSVFASGGGEAGSASVPFAPGSAELSDGARAGLDGIARALAERPALLLTVTGSASGQAEADALRRERLRQLARAEKRRELVAAAPAAPAPPVSQVGMAPAEYPRLLAKVYAAADMPKPRNLVGMARQPPLEDMERLLAEQVDITPESLRALALQRAAAVRDYLGGHGVPAARVFLGAVRLEETPAEGWSPDAQLRLSAP